MRNDRDLCSKGGLFLFVLVHGHDDVFLLPNGFAGWVEVTFEQPGAPALNKDGIIVYYVGTEEQWLQARERLTVVAKGGYPLGYIMELRKLVGSRPLITIGACVLLCNHQRLLLQRRTDNGLWGLPGGSLEPGETLEEVATRELFEETGLRARNLEWFHLFSGKELYYKYPHGDEVYNVVSAYVCTEYDGVPKGQEDEVQELRFFNFREIPVELSPPDKPVIQKFLEERRR